MTRVSVWVYVAVLATLISSFAVVADIPIPAGYTSVPCDIENQASWNIPAWSQGEFVHMPSPGYYCSNGTVAPVPAPVPHNCDYQFYRSGNWHRTDFSAAALVAQLPKTAQSISSIAVRLSLLWGFALTANVPRVLFALADSPNPQSTGYDTIAEWTPNNTALYDVCDTLACYKVNTAVLPTNKRVSLATGKYLVLLFQNNDMNLQFPLMAPVANYLAYHLSPAIPDGYTSVPGGIESQAAWNIPAWSQGEFIHMPSPGYYCGNRTEVAPVAGDCDYQFYRSSNWHHTDFSAVAVVAQLPKTAQSISVLAVRLSLLWGYEMAANVPRILFALADSPNPQSTNNDTIAEWTPTDMALYDECDTLSCYKVNTAVLPTTKRVSLATGKYLVLLFQSNDMNLQFPLMAPVANYLAYKLAAADA